MLSSKIHVMLVHNKTKEDDPRSRLGSCVNEWQEVLSRWHGHGGARARVNRRTKRMLPGYRH